MRNGGLACLATLSVSGQPDASGQVQFHNHVLAGLESRAVLTPPYTDGAQDEEPAEVPDLEAEAAPGRRGADGWRRAYRKAEPEKAAPALKQLKRTFEVGGLETLAWSGRRRSEAAHRAAHDAAARRRQEERAAARRLLRAEGAPVAASAGGSSSSSASDSGSSTASSGETTATSGSE
jgi:hypothetical protein